MTLAPNAFVCTPSNSRDDLLAFLETVFLPPQRGERQHLTERDRTANNLLDLFDFLHAPSRDAPVGMAEPPASDCTPSP